MTMKVTSTHYEPGAKIINTHTQHKHQPESKSNNNTLANGMVHFYLEEREREREF
jgi:hypothetical protein